MNIPWIDVVGWIGAVCFLLPTAFVVTLSVVGIVGGVIYYFKGS